MSIIREKTQLEALMSKLGLFDFFLSKKVMDWGPFLRFVSISWLLLHTYMVVIIETLSACSEVRKEHGKNRIKDEKERQGQIK